MTKNAESRFYTPSTRRLERPAAAGDSRGFRYVLSEAGSRSLEDRLERLSSPYLNPEETLGEIFPAFASTFPRDLWTRLLQFRADPDAPGFGILGNLPVDRHLPPTPHDGKRAGEKVTFVSEACLLGVALILGEPFGYRLEKDGDLVHNVCPVRGRESTRSNESSLSDFQFHTENAFFEYRPQFLLLACLRGHEGTGEAATTVAEAKAACRLLDGSILEELRKPQFLVRSPESCGEVRWSEPTPALLGPGERPELRINLNNMKALGARAEAALGELGRALGDPSILRKFYLRPGEMLLVDNRKAVHGRTPFRPRFDGKDRWLQRVYVGGNLWRTRREGEGSYRVL